MSVSIREYVSKLPVEEQQKINDRISELKEEAKIRELSKNTDKR